LLHFGVFAAVTFDFDDRVEQGDVSMAVVGPHNKVGAVNERLRFVAIGYFEPEAVVFHVGALESALWPGLLSQQAGL
jgi:hypothetical protein